MLLTVLTLTLFKPFGLIDFGKFESADILVAQREGAANCQTTFRLKENYRFTEKVICFGVTDVEGDCKFINDTIYFENVKPGRAKDGFFKFAVIQPSKFYNDGKHFDLVRYGGSNDTTGNRLIISKNDLYRLKARKPDR
jgi:hypothetical protein